ncbi:MAG TPA: site-specific DNA-methyltransferase [Candidatus Dorea faecipullorum]|nr:site-specific DNA-methyltransferase [Candidatus Dorea faecipullorum]
MTNLSGKKRQQMLEFLEKIKEGLSDETSLSTVRDIEEELTTRKYGLVWEKHEERIDQEMQTKVPVFTEIKERRIGMAGREDGYHYLLEGDNLHSLRLLGETCRKKVDCIYIDPPYNTGNKDFIYDDAIVDEKDGFRHSKWLSFMSERLEAAKELLADNGVIFISIDDNEVYALKLLCDEIMGEQNFVTNIIWQKKTGASDARGIATITEYILVYVKDIRRADQIFDKNYQAYDRKRYRFTDEYEEERGPFYYDSLDRGSVRYSDALNYAIEAPDGTPVYPNGRTEFVRDGWTWKWSREKVKWARENGFLEIMPSSRKENGWAVRYKIYLNVDNEGNPVEKCAPYKNVIQTVLNANAAADIKRIFQGETVFKYSKPVELIKILLRYLKKKDALVLDFFAGSGTTGQAVLEQNRQDGGKRHFILCTNNENHICEEITYIRLKRVIEGYRMKDGGKVEGIPANLKYFRTDFEEK